MVWQTDKIWKWSQIQNLTHKTFIRNIHDNVGQKKSVQSNDIFAYKKQSLYESLFFFLQDYAQKGSLKQTAVYLRNRAINNVISPCGKM